MVRNDVAKLRTLLRLRQPLAALCSRQSGKTPGQVPSGTQLTTLVAAARQVSFAIGEPAPELWNGSWHSSCEANAACLVTRNARFCSHWGPVWPSSLKSWPVSHLQLRMGRC